MYQSKVRGHSLNEQRAQFTCQTLPLSLHPTHDAKFSVVNSFTCFYTWCWPSHLSLLFAPTSFPLHSQIARLRSEFIRVSQPPGADPIQLSHWYEEKEKARELTDLANEHSKHNRGGCQTYYKPSSFPCVKWIMGNYREALWNSAYEDSLYRERIAELTKAICWYHIFSILCAL